MAKKKAKNPVTLSSLDAKLDRVIDIVAATQHKVTDIHDRLTRLEQRVDRLVTAMDSFAKSIDDLMLEYAAIKTQLDRHERWFQEIAKKTGIELRP